MVVEKFDHIGLNMGTSKFFHYPLNFHFITIWI